MYEIMCAQCRTKQTDEWWLCPGCNGSLEIVYPVGTTSPQYPLSSLLEGGLGEGQTPLIRLSSLSRELGMELWGKCEFMNPTGSFKDRGSMVEVAKALELKKDGVVCASTGNMAASLAAYAARFNLTCTVVVPAATPSSKLQQAVACGARLVTIAGTYDDCVGRAKSLATKDNLFLCGDYVLRREGQKSIGWELAGQGFDGFVVPVGNGTVGVAIAQGLAEAGDNVRFIGVQPASVNPIEGAWKKDEAIQPLRGTTTIASACNVGNPLDGNLTLAWVRKTAGRMEVANEDQIRRAQRLFACTEGIFVESAAAVGLAGIAANRNQYKGQKLAVILTGTGLKDNQQGDTK